MTFGLVLRSCITGGSTSFTITLNEQFAELPEESVAVAVTTVVPTGKKVPGFLLYVIVTTFEQRSVAVAWKLTTAPHRPGSLGFVIFAGQVIVGGCTSLTVIVNEHVSNPFAFNAMATTV